MEKQVVFFGAGASYGAREPRPPLGIELHQRVLWHFEKIYEEMNTWENEPGTEWENEPGSEIVRQRLTNHLKNASSYESLANTLLEKGETALLIKLNFLLATYMTPPRNHDPKVDDAFVEKRDVYDEWLEKMVKIPKDFKHFTFITLNYDCLLERAICRTFFTHDEREGQCLCTHIHYPFIGGPTTGVEVLKLHGSINWIGDSWGEPGKNGISLPIFLDGSKKISTYKNIELISTCMGRDPDELVLATYAPGKHPQANPQLFKDIKKRAMKKIAEAQKIEIIGVHIPPNEQDDPTLWELFQTLQGKNVDFINPSKVENNLAKISFGFNPIKQSFKEFVDSQS